MIYITITVKCFTGIATSICSLPTKGQLISKCLFGVFTFFQKQTKTSQQVVKLNMFVRFLEEMSA